MLLNNFAFLDLGTPELILILGIVLLLFGGKKLPELSKSLGQSIKELKKGVSEAAELKGEVKKQVSEVKGSWNDPEKEAEAK